MLMLQTRPPDWVEQETRSLVSRFLQLSSHPKVKFRGLFISELKSSLCVYLDVKTRYNLKSTPDCHSHVINTTNQRL